jgi:hypothetical protein
MPHIIAVMNVSDDVLDTELKELCKLDPNTEYADLVPRSFEKMIEYAMCAVKKLRPNALFTLTASPNEFRLCQERGASYVADFGKFVMALEEDMAGAADEAVGAAEAAQDREMAAATAEAVDVGGFMFGFLLDVSSPSERR